VAPLRLSIFGIFNVGNPPVAVRRVEKGAEHVEDTGLYDCESVLLDLGIQGAGRVLLLSSIPKGAAGLVQ
jgi:hypothetical protein